MCFKVTVTVTVVFIWYCYWCDGVIIALPLGKLMPDRVVIHHPLLKAWGLLLVGGLEHFLFSHILGNNHPNWLIFFRGVETTNQIMSMTQIYPNHIGTMVVTNKYGSPSHSEYSTSIVRKKSIWRETSVLQTFNRVFWIIRVEKGRSE